MPSWKLKSMVNFPTFICFLFTEFYLCLGLHLFYVNLKNSIINFSMLHHIIESSTLNFGLFEGCGPKMHR